MPYYRGISWYTGIPVRSILLAVGLATGLSVGGCGGSGASSSAGPTPGYGSCPDLYELAASDKNGNIKSLIVINECNLVVAGYDRSTHASEPQGNSRGFIRKMELNDQGQIFFFWESPPAPCSANSPTERKMWWRAALIQPVA